jgi:hypothetical protein
MKLYYKKIKKQQSKYSVIWKSTRIFRMAEGGAGGGNGGGGGSSSATTRIHVIDPHIVQMMRDVMAGEDSAERLNPNAGGGGGGGGGGGTSAGGPGGNGLVGQPGQRTIVASDGSAGNYGHTGQHHTHQFGGGPGGGGAGGTGGALVIVTTTSEGTAGGNLIVAGGTGGTDGSGWSNSGGDPDIAATGAAGLKVYIQV